MDQKYDATDFAWVAIFPHAEHGLPTTRCVEYDGLVMWENHALQVAVPLSSRSVTTPVGSGWLL